MNRVRTGARNLAWAVGLLLAGASISYANTALTTVPLTINSQDSGAKISVVTPATKTSPATSTPATSPMTLQAGQTIDVEGGSATLTIGTTKVVLSPGTQLQINSGSQSFVMKTNPSFTVTKGSAQIHSRKTFMLDPTTAGGVYPSLYAGSTISTDYNEVEAVLVSLYLNAAFNGSSLSGTESAQANALKGLSMSYYASYFADLTLTQTFDFNPPAQMGGQNSVPVSPSAP